MSRSPTARSVTLRDGRTLALREWPGTGRPLVLLHGMLDSALGWARLAEAVPHPVVAVDLPGFGDSDPPARPRVSAYAEAVLEALDPIGAGDPVIVGHSLGGAVATAIADRSPAWPAALVLLAPAGFGRIPMAEAVHVPGIGLALRLGLPLAMANPAWASATYALMVANGSAPEGELLGRLRRHAFRAVPGTVAACEAIAAAGLSRRAFFKREIAFGGPVLALWGDRDRLVPHDHGHGVTRAFPQAELTVWRGMGHHPQRERPEELAAFIEAAVRRAGSGARARRAA